MTDVQKNIALARKMERAALRSRISHGRHVLECLRDARAALGEFSDSAGDTYAQFSKISLDESCQYLEFALVRLDRKLKKG